MNNTLTLEVLAQILLKTNQQTESEVNSLNQQYIRGRHWNQLDIRREIIKEIKKVNPAFDETEFINATIGIEE